MHIYCILLSILIFPVLTFLALYKNFIQNFYKSNIKILNNFDAGIIITSNNQDIITVNNSAKMIFNISDDELKDLKIKNIIPFYDADENYHNYELNSKLYRKYITLTQHDFIQNNKPKGKILLFRDITEQKISNEIWRRYEFIVNSIKDMMVLLRSDITVAIVNNAFADIFANKFHGILNKHISDILGEELYGKIIEYVKQCFKGERAVYKDWFTIGKLINRYFEITFYPYSNSENDVTHTIMYIKDITDIKLGEDLILEANISLDKKVDERTKELKESEERYRGIVDKIPALICRFLPDTFIITFVNNAYCKYFNMNKEELIGSSFLKLVPLDEHERVTEYLSGFSLKVTNFTYEHKVNTSDGIKWQRWTDQALFDKNGDINEFQSIGIDLTEKIKNEEEIKNANFKLQQLINSISSIMIGLTSDKKITHFNPAAEKIFSIRSEDAVDRFLSDMKIGWDIKKIENALNVTINENTALRFDMINFKDREGNQKILGLNLNPLINISTKKVDGVLIWGADITERKLMETQFAQSQKLESIGQLAAGIAHEINTPIQYIGDNLHFLQDTFGSIKELINLYSNLFEGIKNNKVNKQALNDIVEMEKKVDIKYLLNEIPSAVIQSLDGVGRVSKIVKSMRDFSHPGVELKTLININKSLESTIVISKNEWKYIADIETDFDETLPEVLCYPGEINQVFLNIIINAAHAIEESIKKGTKKEKKGKITIKTYESDKSVVISFADTGSGIPDEIKSKVFDHFFTTKEVGRGTGQGLSIAYTIITKKHNGSIYFESEPGEGTVFFIKLPIK